MVCVRSAVFATVTALVSAAGAQAHTHLQVAVPAADSVVVLSPQEIELSFSEPLELAFSSIVVTDEKNNHVELGSAQLDPDNGRTLNVRLRGLAPGVYTVVWRVLSVDTHRSFGTYTFQVAR